MIVPFRLTFLKLPKKQITASAAKSVLHTVHTYPSAEVFLRSIRKWGGSFVEVLFIKCPHHRWSWGENGFKISHLMMQLLIKYGNIVLTTTTGHRVRYHLCLLLLVCPTGYIVNLSDFYSYRLIGKLTAFLQLQESRGFPHTPQKKSWPGSR